MAIDSSTAQWLKAFVERIERLDEEIAGLNADKREVYAECRGAGFDKRAVQAVVKTRREDPEKRDAHDLLVATYLRALEIAENPATDEVGTVLATRVHAHETFDPETGEVFETEQDAAGDGADAVTSNGRVADQVEGPDSPESREGMCAPEATPIPESPPGDGETATIDYFDIPWFLKRNPDNSLPGRAGCN